MKAISNDRRAITSPQGAISSKRLMALRSFYIFVFLVGFGLVMIGVYYFSEEEKDTKFKAISSLYLDILYAVAMFAGSLLGITGLERIGQSFRNYTRPQDEEPKVTKEEVDDKEEFKEA